MPAHKRALPEPTCLEPGCGRKATFQVYDTFNRLMGSYCGVHANARVERLNQSKG